MYFILTQNSSWISTEITFRFKSRILNVFQIEAENAELKASNDGFVENSKLLASKNNDLQTKVDELLKELSRIRDQEEFLR